MRVKVPIWRTSPTQAVTIDPAATVGAVIGVNLLDPNGKLVPWPLPTPANGPAALTTTDDLDEGQWNLWFTDKRAQDAVGGILADTATIDLAYTAGSITATLKDLADTGTGAALVKITRDAKGRISGTSAATTTDLTEGSNLYYTDARSDARITLQKAQPSGLATLDAVGKLDAGQLPALAITETFVVNTEAAMLALTAEEGDVAVRTDLSKSFILTAAPASTLANWQELLTPTSPVTSVFGRVGSVVAASGDYTKSQVGLGNVDNTSDVNKPVSTAQATSIAMREPAVTAGTTGQFWRGDKTFSNTLTSNLNINGNLAAPGIVPGLFGLYTAGPNSSPVFSQMDVFNSNCGFIFRRANGTSSAPSSVLAGSTIGQFQARGYGSTAYSIEKAQVSFNATESWTDTTQGCSVNISSTPTGTASMAVQLSIDGASTKPGADNTKSCGSSAFRWSVVYAGTGSVNTSDARDKTAVTPLTSVELAAAADLARAIGTYQWLDMVAEKGADIARHHAGLTVQQAIAIMQAHGLDPFRYGFICYDQWGETPEVVSSWPAQDAVLDDAGNVITPAIEAGSEVTQAYRPAGDRYSFRTDELSLFLARGFAARLDALENLP